MKASARERWLGVLVTYFVSVVALLVGIILVVVAQGQEPGSLRSDLFRDFGITLCTIGTLSLIYELVIRRLLLNDVGEALQRLLDRDAPRLKIKRIYGQRSEHDSPISDVLRAADKEVFLYGLTLYGLAVEGQNLLRELARTRRVRLLTFNASSPHVGAMEASLGTSGQLSEYIALSTKALTALEAELRGAKGGQGSFEFRVSDIVPTFSMIALDPKERGGRLFVEFNAYDVSGSECPGMLLLRDEATPYGFYLGCAEKLWELAAPLAAAAAPGGPAVS